MSRLCQQPGHSNSGTRPVYLVVLPPGRDPSCRVDLERTAALGGNAHLLKVNVPEADALAVDGVGDGPVHHLHLLGLHGAGSPRVPAEVVGAGVHVEPGGVRGRSHPGPGGRREEMAHSRRPRRLQVPAPSPNNPPTPRNRQAALAKTALLFTFHKTISGKRTSRYISNVER